MRETYIIRRAIHSLREAAEILAVEQASLGDSPYSPAEILSVMALPRHETYVAVATPEGEVVGFCSCFEVSAHQRLRLEIDLLGVRPAHRGHGLATALIRLAREGARERGIRHIRGIVAVDNIASQRAFERAGLVTSEHPFDLLVYDIQGLHPRPFLPDGWTWQREPRDGAADYEVHTLQNDAGQVVARAEYAHVRTMSYRGLWLEALQADSPEVEQLIARALVERAKSLDLDEVGYLCPDDGRAEEARPGYHSLLREGYQIIGRYRTLTAGEA